MTILKIIYESINGNFESFRFLVSLWNRKIIDELKKERYLEDEITLYLHKETLCKILRQYKEGKIESKLLQKWANMVRDGYFDTFHMKEGDPDRWINIEYESEYDSEHDTELWNQMNEITYRLYEIGDIVDGEIREEELEDWLNNFCKDEICKT
ncbi:MAG: hypothetical protein ACRYGR_10335 [Janthinobacterium lividum]